MSRRLFPFSGLDGALTGCVVRSRLALVNVINPSPNDPRCCHDLSTCRAIPNSDANAGLQMPLPLWDCLPPPVIEIEIGPSFHPMRSFHSSSTRRGSRPPRSQPQARRWRGVSSPIVLDASSSKCFQIIWRYPSRASASHRQHQRCATNDQFRPRLRMHHKHHMSHHRQYPCHRYQHHIILHHRHNLHRMSKHKHLLHLHLHHCHLLICNHRCIQFHNQYFTPFSGPTKTKTIPSKPRFLLSSNCPQRHPRILRLSPLSLHLCLCLAPIRATKAPPDQVPPRWRRTRSRVSSL